MKPHLQAIAYRLSAALIAEAIKGESLEMDSPDLSPEDQALIVETMIRIRLNMLKDAETLDKFGPPATT